MAAKTTSCFTSLKKALLLHTRNSKLFTLLLLLLAVTAFLVPIYHVMPLQPLTDDMAKGSHLTEIKNTGPFSAEYARLLNEIKHDVMKLIIINIALQVVTPAFSFVKQIIAFLMAYMIYFADHYSGIILKVVKVNNLEGPSITIVLVVVALLVSLLSAVVRRRLGVLSGLLFLPAFLILLCWKSGITVTISVEC